MEAEMSDEQLRELIKDTLSVLASGGGYITRSTSAVLRNVLSGY